MSIRTRLTLWYVSLLGIVLVIFSATFYGILSISLNTAVDNTLRDRARQVVTGIAVSNAPLNVLLTGQVRPPALDVFSSQSIFIQIAQPDGMVVTRSQNLGEYTLPVPPEVIASIAQSQPRMIDARVENTTLRIYSVPVLFSNKVIGIVQVAQPLGEVQATLRRVLIALIGGSILALVTATLMGVMLAQMSLRPIDQITVTANKIVSAEDLDQRLSVSGTHDELDRLSLTINNMLARLDNFFQAQVRLSADVSHELRTPLTIIRGNLDILRSPEATPDEETRALSSIESALDRMARLVSDLLLLSQADAGMLLKMRPVELELLLLDVYYQGQALTHSVDLKLGHTEAVAIQGDEDRLKQLLLNLIDNGIKHTPPGGCVTISLYKEAACARISVADTGSGIDPDDLKHIFDRFYRAKGQNRKGSGLGLAIAKWIAEAHQGSLSAESQLGNGSTFILRLPLIVRETVDTQKLSTLPDPI